MSKFNFNCTGLVTNPQAKRNLSRTRQEKLEVGSIIIWSDSIDNDDYIFSTSPAEKKQKRAKKYDNAPDMWQKQLPYGGNDNNGDPPASKNVSLN